MTNEANFYRALVAIETDATRYHGNGGTRPAVLETDAAEALLELLAGDLQALLPGIDGCSLIAAGALYDQTQILRPSFPVFDALERTARRPVGKRFDPRLVSIGAERGRMPVDHLQPMDDIPPGLLQLLPVVVHGPAGLVAELGQAMEERFLERGELSARTVDWLQSAFGIAVMHARMMTLTDLNALLRLQLDHFGFLPLWELLDAALSERDAPLTVTTATAQSYHWADGRVTTTFQTFDYWANHGAGAGAAAAGAALTEGYADWTRELRRYLATLGAHGLDVRLCLPGGNDPLPGTHFVETSERPPEASDCRVTEHSYADLGTVVITVVRADRVEHHYPLQPGGLNEIHDALAECLAAGQTVAYPGTILYDEQTRSLRPESMIDS